MFSYADSISRVLAVLTTNVGYLSVLGGPYLGTLALGRYSKSRDVFLSGMSH